MNTNWLPTIPLYLSSPEKFDVVVAAAVVVGGCVGAVPRDEREGLCV